MTVIQTVVGGVGSGIEKDATLSPLWSGEGTTTTSNGVGVFLDAADSSSVCGLGPYDIKHYTPKVTVNYISATRNLKTASVNNAAATIAANLQTLMPSLEDGVYRFGLTNTCILCTSGSGNSATFPDITLTVSGGTYTVTAGSTGATGFVFRIYDKITATTLNAYLAYIEKMA